VKEYVLDANALVRLYRNAPGADTVDRLVRQAKAGKALLSISVVNLSEVLYILSRYIRPDEALRFIEKTQDAVQAISVDQRASQDAAMLRIRYKLGFADCFAAEQALRIGATLVTADPDFERLGKRLKVLELPRHVH
jgi:predicted nucleic acid-binding protein